MIDIENYTDLAYYYANKSDKRHLQGVELDDLYQCSMIGIWIASQSFDGTRGEFTTYAHKFIEGEINTLVYKVSQIDGKRVRVPRIKEELIGDMLDNEMLTDQHLDSIFEDEYFIDFLKSLDLQEKDKAFFVNMVKYGSKDATSLYMAVNNVTRQRASQVKGHIRKVAKLHKEEIG